MQVFRIKVFSRLNYGVAAGLIVIIGMTICVSMISREADDVYFFILTLFGLSALVFIPNVVSTASTEWEINEDGITIQWLSQFLFHQRTG